MLLNGTGINQIMIIQFIISLFIKVDKNYCELEGILTQSSYNNMNIIVVTFNDGNDFHDHEELYKKYFDKTNFIF